MAARTGFEPVYNTIEKEYFIEFGPVLGHLWQHALQKEGQGGHPKGSCNLRFAGRRKREIVSIIPDHLLLSREKMP
jgi:hypothetical protein